MTKIKEFSGHTARVLHMDQSPDGGVVVTVYDKDAPLTHVSVLARATDKRGATQPLAPRDAIAAMPKGYLYNAAHAVTVPVAKSTRCNHLH